MKPIIRIWPLWNGSIMVQTASAPFTFATTRLPCKQNFPWRPVHIFASVTRWRRRLWLFRKRSVFHARHESRWVELPIARHGKTMATTRTYGVPGKMAKLSLLMRMRCDSRRLTKILKASLSTNQQFRAWTLQDAVEHNIVPQWKWNLQCPHDVSLMYVRWIRSCLCGVVNQVCANWIVKITSYAL